jgi:hypothetical protein
VSLPRTERDALVAALAALPDAALSVGVSSTGGEQTLSAILVLGLAGEMESRLEIAAALAATGWDAPAAVRHL